eukprot:1159522-Pelagomonas_calceolata.AAC.6
MWPPAPLPKPPPPPKAPNVPHGEWPWRPCAKGSEWCCKPSVKVDRPCTRAASQHTAAMPHRHCVHDRGLALQGAAAMEGLTAAVVLAGLREAHSSANKRCAGHAVPRQVPSTVFRTLSILSTLGTCSSRGLQGSNGKPTLLLVHASAAAKTWMRRCSAYPQHPPLLGCAATGWAGAQAPLAAVAAAAAAAGEAVGLAHAAVAGLATTGLWAAELQNLVASSAARLALLKVLPPLGPLAGALCHAFAPGAPPLAHCLQPPPMHCCLGRCWCCCGFHAACPGIQQHLCGGRRWARPPGCPNPVPRCSWVPSCFANRCCPCRWGAGAWGSGRARARCPFAQPAMSPWPADPTSALPHHQQDEAWGRPACRLQRPQTARRCPEAQQQPN